MPKTRLSRLGAFAFGLSLFLLLAPQAQEQESPSKITHNYLLAIQKLALYWVKVKPWPSHYEDYVNLAKLEVSPLLSAAALSEFESRPTSGPQELIKAKNGPTEDDKEFLEGKIQGVARASFTILSEEIHGDEATVEVETTIKNLFGSGKTESFQDRLRLVREQGRWLLTPQAANIFSF